MSNRFVFPEQQWFNANGNPLSGGQLYFYQSGTTTKKDVYADEALTTPLSNPVVADSAGVWPDIWMDGTYTVKLTDADDVQIFSKDGVAGPVFEDVGKEIGDIPEYEDDGSGNAVIRPPYVDKAIGGLTQYEDDGNGNAIVLFPNSILNAYANRATTRTLTSATTLTSADHGRTILCDASGGAFTVTLPSHSDGFRVTFVLIDATNDVTIEDSGASTVTTLTEQGQSPTVISDGTNWRITGRTTEELVKPVSSTDPGLAFGTWRTPNANRPTQVFIATQIFTDGATIGQVRLDCDESGGTTADFTINQNAPKDLGSLSQPIIGTFSVIIPSGGSFRIVNESDPTGNNSVGTIREWNL